jgi:4-hydroxyphenylpyruvate dioxygenase
VLIRDHGLEITLFQPFRDFEGLTGAARDKAFERARYKFDTMAALGTDLILVCSSSHPEALGGIGQVADDFAALGEIAAERDLRVGYEALAWGRHVNDDRDAWEIVRRADHPNVGLILDSFHRLARKIDPNTIRRIPRDKIFFVQIADAPAIDMDPLYWSRHFRNMPGEGDLPVTEFIIAVAATGYDGPISLEIFNDQFRGGRPESLARRDHGVREFGLCGARHEHLRYRSFGRQRRRYHRARDGPRRDALPSAGGSGEMEIPAIRSVG